MSDGLSDFLRMDYADQFRVAREQHKAGQRDWYAGPGGIVPIVPKRITEYGRLMLAADLGLDTYKRPPFFWLGREAEAA